MTIKRAATSSSSQVLTPPITNDIRKEKRTIKTLASTKSPFGSSFSLSDKLSLSGSEKAKGKVEHSKDKDPKKMTDFKSKSVVESADELEKIPPLHGDTVVTLPDTQDFKSILTAFYEKHNPSRIEEVDKTLQKYKGREGEMFTKLAKKYNVSSPLEQSKANISLITTPASSTTAHSPKNSSDYRIVLTKFYETYNPSRLGEVDKTLQKYKGREAEMFEKLAKKYNVNNPLLQSKAEVSSTSSSFPTDTTLGITQSGQEITKQLLFSTSSTTNKDPFGGK